jgi:predicted nucleotidyltransferase component of viral defense system
LIPAAYITAWSKRAPWPYPYQVEQDLILSRLMVEIATDELLRGELRLRGGTCLHKLHLERPFRYSEDLDYVRSTRSGVKPYVEAIQRIGDGMQKEPDSVLHSSEFGWKAKSSGIRSRFRVMARTSTLVPKSDRPTQLLSMKG